MVAYLLNIEIDYIKWGVTNFGHYPILAYVVPNNTLLPPNLVYLWLGSVFIYQWEREASNSEISIVIAITFAGLMLLYPVL